MRIGWRIPLPGPISVGGTVYRSRRSSSKPGCLGWLIGIVAVGYAYFWPFIMLPGKPAEWFIGVPWLIVALTLTVCVLVARSRHTSDT